MLSLYPFVWVFPISILLYLFPSPYIFLFQYINMVSLVFNTLCFFDAKIETQIFPISSLLLVYFIYSSNSENYHETLEADIMGVILLISLTLTFNWAYNFLGGYVNLPVRNIEHFFPILFNLYAYNYFSENNFFSKVSKLRFQPYYGYSVVIVIAIYFVWVYNVSKSIFLNSFVLLWVPFLIALFDYLCDHENGYLYTDTQSISSNFSAVYFLFIICDLLNFASVDGPFWADYSVWNHCLIYMIPLSIALCFIFDLPPLIYFVICLIFVPFSNPSFFVISIGFGMRYLYNLGYNPLV